MDTDPRNGKAASELSVSDPYGRGGDPQPFQRAVGVDSHEPDGVVDLDDCKQSSVSTRRAAGRGKRRIDIHRRHGVLRADYFVGWGEGTKTQT